MVAGDNGHNLHAYAFLCIFRKQKELPTNLVLRGDSWSTQSTNIYDQPIGYNI